MIRQKSFLAFLLAIAMLASSFFITDNRAVLGSSSFAINLSAVKTASATAYVSWNAVPNATGYDVQFKRADGVYKDDSEYSSGTSYTSTDMLNLVYWFRVRAKFSDGNSEWVEVWVNISDGLKSTNNGNNSITLDDSDSNKTGINNGVSDNMSVINDSTVFLKQESEQGRCTLVSALMMFRRAELLAGDSRWSEYTEEKYKNDTRWWNDGLVQTGRIYGHGDYYMEYNKVGLDVGDYSDTWKNYIIACLDSRKEGLVIWVAPTSSPNHWHAVLLTDYDKKTNTFYCADPASGAPNGRIPLEQSILAGLNYVGQYTQKANNTQEDIIAHIWGYWIMWNVPQGDQPAVCPIDHTAYSPAPNSNFETKRINGKWTAVCKSCGEEFKITEGTGFENNESYGIGNYKVLENTVSVCETPYSEGSKSTKAKDSVVKAIAYTFNAYGNYWIKISENEWICGEYTNSSGQKINPLQKVFYSVSPSPTPSPVPTPTPTAAPTPTPVVTMELDNEKPFKLAESESVSVGESVTADIEIYRDDLFDEDLLWTSSNPAIASVDAGGSITGISVGSATITASMPDGTYKAICTVTVNLPTVSIKKLAAKTSYVKVSWKKRNGIDGYQIAYSTTKEMTGEKYTTAKASAVSKKFKKLTKGSKYYFKIRTYKIVNGKKIYSKWSKVKSIKY